MVRKINNIFKSNKSTVTLKSHSVHFLASKKSFVFSFLAIFLSFMIFAFGSLYLFQGDFTKEDGYKDSRITYLDNEIKYFKNVYIVNAISFSYYNTINLIVQNKTYLNFVENNYSNLNSLVYEGMTNGSLNGINKIELENKTINYFLTEFQNSFNENFLANFSFNMSKINIYQIDTYKLSLQAIGVYNITTSDEISSWNFEENIFVSIPIYSLRDPEFFMFDNLNYTLRPAELYASNFNWSIQTYNETLKNVYSTIYLQPDFKYTIGNNYLAKILNISRSSYDNVLAFWSFDYDEEMEQVYDTTSNSPFVSHFGNSKLLMNFDISTIFGTTVLDLSDYHNDGILMNGVDCSISGVSGNACLFDGVDDIIEGNFQSSFNVTNKISLSSWFKSDGIGGTNPRILEVYPNLGNWQKSSAFAYDNDGTLRAWVTCKTNNLRIGSINYFNKIYNDSKWHNSVYTYDGLLGKLYIDGILVDTSLENSCTDLYDVDIFAIGGHVNLATSHGFNGSIDEVAIYSKVLNEEEVSILYDSKKAKFIDYKNSLHGKAIEFDGVDDYIYLDNITNENPIFDSLIKVRSGEFWFKTYNSTKTQIIYKEGGEINGVNVYINDSKVYFGAYSKGLGWTGSWISYPIIENQWNYVVYTFDNISTNSMNLFLNGKLVNTSIISSSINGHPRSDSIGSIIGKSILNDVVIIENSFYFQGLIDEVKFYDRILSPQEIEQNYYNYASFSKGCCNYLNLIDSNLMGYNSTLYSDNISSSSKVFYDYYRRGGNLNKSLYDMILINVTNITSYLTYDDHYYFLADDCLKNAYAITYWDYHKRTGLYNFSCSNLIKAGIY